MVHRIRDMVGLSLNYTKGSMGLEYSPIYIYLYIHEKGHLDSICFHHLMGSLNVIVSGKHIVL